MVVRPSLTKMDGSWVIVQTQTFYENQILEQEANITKRVDQNNNGVPDRRDSSNCAFKSVLCK